MAIKWDKEKIILSVAGSLATIALGYLIWRHENTVQQSEAAQNEAASEAQDAQLQQEIASLPQYTQGGGASEDGNDSGSDSNIESPPSDSELAAILAAFFPTGIGTSTNTPVSTPTSGSGGAGTPTIPVSNNGAPNGGGKPSSPITPVTNPTPYQPPSTNPSTGSSPNPSPIITRPNEPIAYPIITRQNTPNS